MKKKVSMLGLIAALAAALLFPAQSFAGGRGGGFASAPGRGGSVSAGRGGSAPAAGRGSFAQVAGRGGYGYGGGYGGGYRGGYGGGYRGGFPHCGGAGGLWGVLGGVGVFVWLLCVVPVAGSSTTRVSLSPLESWAVSRQGS